MYVCLYSLYDSDTQIAVELYKVYLDKSDSIYKLIEIVLEKWPIVSSSTLLRYKWYFFVSRDFYYYDTLEKSIWKKFNKLL